VKLKIAAVLCALLIAGPSIACEINGLTEAIDLLKRGDEPNARSAALACAGILQDREIEKNMAQLILILHATFDQNERLKEAIRNCPADMMRRAC
jgi:hypothetical protein